MGFVHAAIAGTENERKRREVEVTAQEVNGDDPYLQPLENEQNVR